MSWLASYRRQLADEATGRNDRIARVLRWFRHVWHVSVVAGVAFVIFGIWYVSAHSGDGSGGMAFIVFPFGALLIAAAGGAAYGFAQLFLSVRKSAEMPHDD